MDRYSAAAAAAAVENDDDDDDEDDDLNSTVCIPNRRIRRSALEIVESDGLHSKSSNVTVCSPNQSRCESKCYDSNEGGGSSCRQPL